MICTLCPHLCDLKEGEKGYCLSRMNKDNKIISLTYSKITSLSLDPIEKKPLYHFYPYSKILSVGSYGCNLKCPFCQNNSISQEEADYKEISVDELIDTALDIKDNIGIAFTYNEPFINYEYVYQVCKKAKEKDLKTVLITNGMINKEPILTLLPYIDALNIDLKGFRQDIYDVLGGDLEAVKQTIELSYQYAHIEITSLIVPGLNDSIEDMVEEVKWLSSIDKDIPLHITRYFPRYKYTKPPTKISLLKQLQIQAKQYMTYVYLGNC